MDGLGAFLDSYGLLAIFAVMLAKEIGVPVPVPSDLIMLAAASESASGRFVLWQAFGVILLAMVLGAWLQFVIARTLGRAFLSRFGRYVGLSEQRLDSVASSIRRGGASAVALSLLTPGVRVATVPASGLARMPYEAFLPGLLVGSAGFLALHFAIGYAAGPLVEAALRAAGLPLVLLAVAILLVGLIGWLGLRKRAATRGDDSVDTLEELRNWENASCPVCLGIGVVHHLRHARTSREVEIP